MNKLLYILPKLSVYAVVFLVPLIWAPWTFEAFEFNKQYALFILVFFGITAWLAKMILKDKELRFRKTPIDIPVLAFLLASFLSIVFSVDRIASLIGFYGRFSDGFIGVLSLVGLYFLITNHIDIKREGKKLLNIFFASTGIIVLISYLSLFEIWQRFELLPSIIKQSSFYLVADSLEGLVMFLVVVVILLSAQRTGLKSLHGVLHLALLLGAMGLLMLIDFNSAWVVLVVSLLLLIVVTMWQNMQSNASSRQTVPLVILSIALILLFSSITIQRESIPKEELLGFDTSWSVAWNTVSDNAKNIFVGSGIGTYSIDFSQHRPVEFNQTSLWQTRFDRAGNYISELLATTGIVGFIAYLVLIGMFLVITFIVFSASFAKKNTQTIAVQTTLALLTLLVSQFFFYQNTVLALLFWFMLAMTMISLGLPRQEMSISLKKLFKIDIVAKTILVLISLVFAGTIFVVGSSYMADMQYLKSQTSINIAQKIGAGLRAVSLNPFQAEYRIHLSKMYLSRVSDELKKSSSQQDKNLIATDVQKALAYIRGGDVKEKSIAGAVQIAPNRVDVWETLGVVYRDIQFAEGAIDWGITAFKKAIELEPSNPVLREGLGKLYAEKEEFDLAKEEFDIAIELKSDYIPAQIQSALLYEKEGDSKLAVSILEKLYDRSFSIEVAFQLGRLYYNQGRTKDAITQFQKIIKVSPNHSNAHYSLGVAFEKQGKIADAKREFERVLQLNPGNKAIEAKLKEL